MLSQMVSTTRIVITVIVLLVLIIGVILTLYLITRYTDTSISSANKFVDGALIEIRSLWNGLFLIPYATSSGYGIEAAGSQGSVNAVWVAKQDPATGNYYLQNQATQSYITVNGSNVTLGPLNGATPLIFTNFGGTITRPNPAFLISLPGQTPPKLVVDGTTTSGIVIASTTITGLASYYQIQVVGFSA